MKQILSRIRSLSTLLLTVLAFCAGCVLCVSCSDDTPGVQPSPSPTEKPHVSAKIAVVLPMDASHRQVWDAAATLFQNFLLKGQQSLECDTLFMPEIEWYDEDTEDLEALAARLAEDDSVKVIIGPFSNEHVFTFTQKCASRRKPVIAPQCTSTELCRKNASKNFFWSLTESDVTQLRLMLSYGALRLGGKKMGLIASKGETGATYLNWIGYEATELNVHMDDKIHSYSADATDQVIADNFREAMQDTDVSVLLCAPATEKEAAVMLSTYGQYQTDQSPSLIFSDRGYSSLMTASKVECPKLNVMGLTPYADPSSGFTCYFFSINENYSNLTGGAVNASLFYDALEIATLACIEVWKGRQPTYSAAVADVVAYADNGVQRTIIYGWDQDDITKILEGIFVTGKKYDVVGASGAVQFNPNLQSSSTRTVYLLWRYGYYNQDDKLTFDFDDIDYITKDGTSRTASNSVIWAKASTVFQKIEGKDFTYGELGDQWAILVAASLTWDNYRHTADVLNMYRLLRDNGYPADHIFVIAQRDLSTDNNNPHPGEILDYYGNSLYNIKDTTGEKIDCQVKDLKNSYVDIFNLLKGQSIGSSQRSLPIQASDNVLVYWSGHGSQRGFTWGDDLTALTPSDVRTFLQQYTQFRKMLWITEPCYSGVMEQVFSQGDIPHVLFLTSSNATEVSKGCCNSDEYGWMADLFSYNVVQLMKSQPDISFGNLYEKLIVNTYGSHPQVFGANTFGKMYSTYPKEFFIYNSK